MRMTETAALAILAYTSSTVAYYNDYDYGSIYAREAYPMTAEYDEANFYAREAEPSFDYALDGLHPRDAYLAGFEAGIYSRNTGFKPADGSSVPPPPVGQRVDLSNSHGIYARNKPVDTTTSGAIPPASLQGASTWSGPPPDNSKPIPLDGGHTPKDLPSKSTTASGGDSKGNPNSKPPNGGPNGAPSNTKPDPNSKPPNGGPNGAPSNTKPDPSQQALGQLNKQSKDLNQQQQAQQSVQKYTNKIQNLNEQEARWQRQLKQAQGQESGFRDDRADSRQDAAKYGQMANAAGRKALSFEKQAGPNGQGPPNGQAGSNGPGKPDGQGPPGAGGPGSAPANGGPRPGGSDKPTQGGPNGQGTPNQPSKQGGPGQGAVGGGSKPDLRELYGYDSPAVEQGAGSGGAAIGSGIPLIVRRGVVDWLYEYEW